MTQEKDKLVDSSIFSNEFLSGKLIKKSKAMIYMLSL